MRTIAHLSDIHFNRVNRPVAEALIRDVAEFAPSLLIVSGDLTQRARVSQFCQAMALLANLPRPQMVLAGNHDVPLFNLFRRAFSPLGRFKRLVTTDLMPVYRDEEMLAIGLNTASRGSLRPRGFWKDGHVSKADLSRAAAVLRDAPAGLAKIIVTHHPFVSHDPQHRGDVVRNGGAVLAALSGLGVDVALAGHLHTAYHAEIAEGTFSIQAGTACSARLRSQPNSYNRLTVTSDAIELNVRVYKDGAFTAGDSLRFDRRARHALSS